MLPPTMLNLVLVAALALLVGGCPTGPDRAQEGTSATRAEGALNSLRLGAPLEDRIFALNPERISATDVRDTLSKAPAPRIVLIHGGIYPVFLAMSSFADFLVAMGYPETALHRQDGVVDSVYSYSPYQDSTELAGMVAWYYERDGMRPMIVGHSQGGVQAVKGLGGLAGVFGSEIPVWNPIAGVAGNRTAIVGPVSRARRPGAGG